MWGKHEIKLEKRATESGDDSATEIRHWIQGRPLFAISSPMLLRTFPYSKFPWKPLHSRTIILRIPFLRGPFSTLPRSFITLLSMRPPIRLAILEADTPLDKTRATYGGYGDVFEALLQAATDDLGNPDIIDPQSGLDISMWNVEDHPDKYPKMEEIDAILITGSSELLHRHKDRLEADAQCKGTIPSMTHPGSKPLSTSPRKRLRKIT